jgi:tight adherence protein B
MTLSFEFILYLLIFIAVLALVEGIYLTVFGKSISLNSRVNRRLDLLEKGAERKETLEKLTKRRHCFFPKTACVADGFSDGFCVFQP